MLSTANYHGLFVVRFNHRTLATCAHIGSPEKARRTGATELMPREKPSCLQITCASVSGAERISGGHESRNGRSSGQPLQRRPHPPSEKISTRPYCAPVSADSAPPASLTSPTSATRLLQFAVQIQLQLTLWIRLCNHTYSCWSPQREGSRDKGILTSSMTIDGGLMVNI